MNTISGVNYMPAFGIKPMIKSKRPQYKAERVRYPLLDENGNRKTGIIDKLIIISGVGEGLVKKLTGIVASKGKAVARLGTRVYKITDNGSFDEHIDNTIWVMGYESKLKKYTDTKDLTGNSEDLPVKEFGKFNVKK